MSTRRYHFVVPSDALLSEPDSVPAMVEAAHAAQQAAQADAGTQSLRGGKVCGMHALPEGGTKHACTFVLVAAAGLGAYQ